MTDDLHAEDHFGQIAIVGMAARLPGAPNTSTYWHNLTHAVESISQFSDAELLEAGIDPALLQDEAYVKACGIIEDSDCFDASFFGYSANEATLMDPQIRVFMETAWQALEDAGYDPERYSGRIGLFSGMSMSTYLFAISQAAGKFKTDKTLQARILNDKDFLSTWVSYKFNLRGPSVSVQNACSTSLVATHLAIQSLLSGECEMAMAGGVTINALNKAGYTYHEGGIYSPDGHCRAFDAKARGTVMGNGAGVVLLKKLDDALHDRDHIYAVIRGTAINNDGSEKVSFTAPSPTGQTEVIAEALEISGVDADTITYVETHGTGTNMGDPTEIEALTEAFRHKTEANGFCAIGSVKTNIGHLDAAAGVAGLIKTALALQNAQIPPSLNYDEPNPEIHFETTPFFVNTQLCDWEAKNGEPRRAGLSSFGVGGTNAHAILEEAPQIEREQTQASPQVLVLSARTKSALDQAAHNLADHLRDHQTLNLADVAHTLQVGRKRFEHRAAIACSSTEAAIQALESQAFNRGEHHQGKRAPAFMFPGQGCQFAGMGHQLYRDLDVYRETVDSCLAFLNKEMNLDLAPFLTQPANGDTQQRISETFITQPAIFVTSYALAKQWMAWGLQPAAMIGHSIGEYAAACLAGVFELKDALKMVALRGKLIQQLPKGDMLAVRMTEARTRELLTEDCAVAAVNGPEQVVVSGSPRAIAAFKQKLDAQGISGKLLETSHAFHSAMLDPILQTFEDHVGQLKRQAPSLPFISNVTGQWISESEAVDPTYWSRHLRGTVRFADGLTTLLNAESLVPLEVGPGQTLSKLSRRQSDLPKHLPAPSLPGGERAEVEALLQTLGDMWISGVEVDWNGIQGETPRYRTPLPTYPFERKRYRIEMAEDSGITINQRKSDMADWFYLPTWRIQAAKPAPTPAGSSYLILGNHGAVNSLFDALKEKGSKVTQVTSGDVFEKTEWGYSINPAEHEHYERLLTALDETPSHVVHAWNVADFDEDQLNQDHAFFSLVYLARALAASNQDIKLLVVSNKLHNVLGDEDPSMPLKALLLGPCKVIPLEHPNIACTALDLELDPLYPQIQQAAEQILAELHLETDDRVVAVRGKRRFVQTYEPVRLDGKKDTTHLRDKGTYLITGGFGGVGLAIAEHLAREVKAKLVLLGRSQIPTKDEAGEWHWPNGPQSNERFDLAQAAATISHRERELEAELKLKTVRDFAGLEDKLTALCTGLIHRYFTTRCPDLTAGVELSEAALADKLGVLPKFRKFYDFFVATLVKAGVISQTGDHLRFEKNSDESPDPDKLGGEICRDFPNFASVIDLLKDCAAGYGPALSGEIEAISVLYPDGRSDKLDEAMAKTAQYTNGVLYSHLAAKVLDLLPQRDSLRILEVGAGNGNLTKILAPVLRDSNVSYHFTDLGKFFVNNAEKRADELVGASKMRFDVLDISKDALEQGFEAHGYDLIFGLEVVHATPSLAQTTGNLKQLLAPNGLLCLLESLHVKPWIEMVWGLAEGWWYFEDDDVRSGSPITPPETWQKVLEGVGFPTVRCFPLEAEKRAAGDLGLFIAQQDAEIEGVASLDQSRNALPERLAALEALGAEVLPIQADVADRMQMESALAKVHAQFGGVNGVVHAAGALSDGLIRLKKREAVEKVFAAKVNGTLILDDLLKEEPLDFMLLCSSLAAIYGNFSQVDHSAANNFLDAFALAREGSEGPRVISLNWCNWKDVGAAVDVNMPRALKTMLEENQRQGMTSVEGVLAFRRVLAGGYPQVLVSTTDVAATFAQYRQFATLTEQLTDNALRSVRHERPELATVYTAPRDKLEEALAEVWCDLLGFEQVGVDDDFFDLGGDSLIGISVVNRVQKMVEETVHITALLDAPTVARFSAYLREHYPVGTARILGEEVDGADQAVKPITDTDLTTFREVIHHEVAPVDGRRNRKMAFLLSAPRSGSTLMRVMLAGNPALFAPPEMELLQFGSLKDRREAVIQDASLLEGTIEAVMQSRNVNADEAEKLMAEYEQNGTSALQFYGLLQEWIGDRLLVEKSPSYALNPDVLQRAEDGFEGTRYIHLVRHPYAMIHSYEEARLDLLFSKTMRGRLPFSRRQLAELTWLVTELNIRGFLEDIPDTRKHMIKFEDLLADPEKTMRNICTFLDVPYHDDMLEPYKEKQQRMTAGVHEESRMLGDVKFHGHGKIDAAVAENWRNKYLEDFLGERTLKLADELGYAAIDQPSQADLLLEQAGIDDLEDDQLMDQLDGLSDDDLDALLKEQMAEDA